MPFHSHDEIEIMYVIEGKCVVETAAETVTMKKGDLILLDSNIEHRLIVAKENPCRMLNLEFFLQTKTTSDFHHLSMKLLERMVCCLSSYQKRILIFC